MPDEETSKIYGEMKRRGLLTRDPETAKIAHELRARGLVVDRTQGGRVRDPEDAVDPMGDPFSGPRHADAPAPPRARIGGGASVHAQPPAPRPAPVKAQPAPRVQHNPVMNFLGVGNTGNPGNAGDFRTFLNGLGAQVATRDAKGHVHPGQLPQAALDAGHILGAYPKMLYDNATGNDAAFTKDYNSALGAVGRVNELPVQAVGGEGGAFANVVRGASEVHAGRNDAAHGTGRLRKVVSGVTSEVTRHPGNILLPLAIPFVPKGLRGIGGLAGRAAMHDVVPSPLDSARPRMTPEDGKPTTLNVPRRAVPPARAVVKVPRVSAPGVKPVEAASMVPKTAPATSDPRLVSNFPTDQLHTDPERFQYKIGSGQGGQTGSLTGAKAYNPDLAGIAHVWRDPADGKVYVVNGHNRKALADRTGAPGMDVRFLDAPTAEDARTTGALINIAEGQGSALDAAKLFKDQKISPDELAQQGVNLKGEKARQGLALSHLNPSLFGQVVRGDLSVERAAIIGEKLPDPADQMVLVGELDKATKRGKTITNDTVSEIADQIKDGPRHTETSASLFGDDIHTRTLAVERAEVSAYVKGQLSKEGAAFGGAAKNADRLAKGNNVIDAETSQRIADENRQGAELFDRVKNQGGPVSQLLTRAAARLAKGENPNVVKAEALSEYQNAIPALLKSGGTDTGTAEGVRTGAADGEVRPGAQEAPGQVDLFAGTPAAPDVAPAESLRAKVTPKAAAVPNGAHGSPIHELNAPPTTAAGRIDPAPIAGGTPKKLSQITLDLSHAVGRRVGVAKLGRGAAGTYTPASAKTSIRFAGDLDTTAHEIAHALDDQHGIVAPWKDKRVRSPYDAELKPFWEAGGSQTKSGPRSLLSYKRGEGVAEFVRAYIVNPDEAKARAPQFYQHFVATVPADTLGKIHDFSLDVRQFAGLSASEKIGANVGLHAERTTPTQALVAAVKGEGWDFETTGLDRLQYAVQDTLKPFTKAVQAARQVTGKGTLPADDPIVLARTHSGVGGKVLNILDKGMIDAQGARVTPGGVDWLLDPFDKTTHENLTADLGDTVKYMVAQRTLEKGQQLGRDRVTGIGGGLYSDIAVARQALKEFGADPARLARLEEGAKRYRQWADALLQYQVQKGRMSQAAYNAIKANNDYYVALQRETDKINPPHLGVGNSNTKLGAAKQTVHAFKGSTREIQNPYRTLMDQTHAMIRESDRNEVLKSFRDMLTIQRDMHDGPVKNLAAIGQRAKVGDPNTITIFVDGKPEYWQFEKGVYESLKGFGSDLQLPKLSTFLPSLMRSAVTHDPGFLVRNVFRDAIDRTLLSKHGGKPWDVIGKTSEADRDAFDLSGGGQAGHYLASKEGYGRAMESAVKKLSEDKNSIVALPGDFLEKYQHLAHSSEMVGRYAEYKKAFAHAKNGLGYDDYNASLYAASEARGLMDFAVAGNVGRVMNQYVPFTNAAIQGGANLLRSARANPKAFLGKWVTYVVVPEMAVYAWNMSQGKDTRDEYRSLPAYQRDLFWNFKVGPDLWVRVPKGFEMATLASGVSRSVDYATGNKTAFDGYTGDLAKSLIPVSPDLLASGLLPSLAENAANHDAFRDTSIVPPYEDKLRLDLRKGAGKASRLGQAVGKVLTVDPRKVDHFVRSQFGGMGVMAARVSDIGRPDKTSVRDLLTSLPGILASSPAVNSPDVQAVMDNSARLGRPNPLKVQMDALYAARTPTEKDAAARALRERAHVLRPGLDADMRKPPDLLKLLSEGTARRRHGPHRPTRPHR